MLNKLKLREDVFNSQDLSGFYFGSVVDVSDSLRLSRVRVSIPFLTDGIDTNMLPWYAVKQSFGVSLNNFLCVPSLGSVVVVEFPMNDIYNGVVSYAIANIPMGV